MATLQNIVISQGASWGMQVVWTDDATGLPVDLAGADLLMQLRSFPASPEVVAELSLANGRIVVSETGVITALLTPEVTKLLPVTSGVYEMRARLPGGFVGELVEGRFVVEPAVVRWV